MGGHGSPLFYAAPLRKKQHAGTSFKSSSRAAQQNFPTCGSSGIRRRAEETKKRFPGNASPHTGICLVIELLPWFTFNAPSRTGTCPDRG